MANFMRGRSIALAMVGATAVAGLSACTFSGGGTFMSDSQPNQKVSVGGDMQCNLNGSGSGTLSFIDRNTIKDGTRVSIEATVTGCLANLAYGTYQPRPNGTPGKFSVIVVDSGKSGPDKGDSMALSLSGGRFGGYKFAGTLAGGNFTFTP